MQRLTDNQVYQDNPHFKGEIERGKVFIHITIIKPYKIYGTNRVTDLQKYPCFMDVRDTITGYQASYLWDAINKQWSLGAN